MWNFIKTLFGGITLAEVAENIELDIDTVQKASGTYLRVRVEVYGFKLLDKAFRVAGQGEDAEGKSLAPVDVYYNARQDRRLKELEKNTERQLNKALKKQAEKTPYAEISE